MTVVEADGGRHVELADAAMAGADLDAAASHLSTAIRAFTAAGDVRRAALACARLGDLFATYLGNQTAGRAWFRRATRLVADEPPCLEQGWIAVAAMGCDVDDPAALLAGAELALDRARRFGDVNLETKALADAGLAHVQAGRVAEGMALLDEAMALACGPADDVETAGKSVCSFLTACCYAADFDRAGSWAGALRKQGLIGGRGPVQAFLTGHCDAVQATLLVELGQWAEAEDVLVRAIESFERFTGVPSWHPAIALAELRIRQGRLADAELLLLGKEGQLQALLPTARLHVARGDVALARATAARGLRLIGADRLRAAELLAVLVDAELAAGDPAAAAAACDDLVRRAAGLEVPGLAARVAVLQARVAAARGDGATTVATLESALAALPPAGAPLLRATVLLELARRRLDLGDRAAATVEAAQAAASLDGLDVTLPPADAALLDELAPGRPPAPTVSPAARTATIAPADRGWWVQCGGDRARLGDTKGVRYLVELLRHPGVERHVLDLVDRVEGVAAGPGPDRRHLGDAGELLDATARAEYRHRIEALRSEIDDAVALGAETRAEARQDELDRLVAELARAFGVGGRARRASSAAERARLNVTRALRAATARVAEALPEAGGMLDARLRTGLYCAFEPRDDDPVRWIVQSGPNGDGHH